MEIKEERRMHAVKMRPRLKLNSARQWPLAVRVCVHREQLKHIKPQAVEKTPAFGYLLLEGEVSSNSETEGKFTQWK